jgi:hypothetical protein
VFALQVAVQVSDDKVPAGTCHVFSIVACHQS